MWPGQDPIGQTIRIEPPDGRPSPRCQATSQVIVVGVVGDIVSGMLFSGRDTGHIYLPTSVADAHATAILVRGRTTRDLGPQAFHEIFKRAVDAGVEDPAREIRSALIRCGRVVVGRTVAWRCLRVSSTACWCYR
jgi:hypothetical protein